MEELTKQVVQKTIAEITTSLQKGNYVYSNDLSSGIIDFSLMTNSEMGVFIGEVLEAVLIEYTSLFNEHIIENDEERSQIDIILPLIDEINSSVSLNDDQMIYSALSKLRLYVTKQQKAFPLLYRQRITREPFL